MFLCAPTSRALLVGLCLFGSAVPAVAANCDANGGLAYLGNIRDGSNSVWLSGTSAGSFSLEAAQGSQTVDTWSKTRRGLHLSLSPFVSSGNGGTHKLYSMGDNKPCLLDTQNQKRDFRLPPLAGNPAVVLPGRVVPPIGILFPDFAPPIGTLPGGVVPPIGSLPGGVTPPIGTLPGGVTPPIGTLPGGVTPPIGTLPGGVTPPIGTLPGGVTPPIGTLPGGVTPPIGTLPGGVTPPIGTLPGGVTPPIGTLPGGVTPPIGTLPGGVTPPIGTLPGPGVVMPPPIIIVRPGTELSAAHRGARTAAGQPVYYCVDPRSSAPDGKPRTDELPVCSQEILSAYEQQRQALANQVPLTEGRQFGQQALWNFRMGGRALGISDERYGLDLDTNLQNVTFSLDRRFSENVVAGITFSLETSDSDGFGGDLKVDTDGFSVGPYVAVRLSPQWAVDTSLTYGHYNNDMELSVLDGSYDTDRYSAQLNLHGQYKVDEYFIRPKATVSFSHIVNDAYDLNGDILSLPVSVELPEESFNYGYLEATTEVSRVMETPDGTPFMAFAEVGAKYEFERPNDGRILTGDLSLATPSPWSFSLRSGVRMLLSEALQLEASAGYLSFGQNDLDVWDGKIELSVSF
ncbi:MULTISPECIES: autotransporter domain-containing protein [unclassified Ensifer]|uniref:autotransporter domain-containing protein n=1 Tax=unclassified Ensifer TaxID=2633371 RepID=UPI000813BC6B|nr:MULTISPECIES: autotransporter domain-containing protein [unclassified Ensifer]OCP21264.1 hypothetical protein BC363_28595 [Ensifer sp. LC384]OCP21846.1 hypothetical protein BC361_26210 [Ensifer sp. LC54]